MRVAAGPSRFLTAVRCSLCLCSFQSGSCFLVERRLVPQGTPIGDPREDLSLPTVRQLWEGWNTSLSREDLLAFCAVAGDVVTRLERCQRPAVFREIKYLRRLHLSSF